jgi:thymidylate synthase
MPFSPATKVWLENIAKVFRHGISVSPRGNGTRELIGFSSTIDMSFPVVTVLRRKLSRKFLAGEAWWILSGRNDVESIAKYNKRIAEYSDDGRTFFGAYGPRIASQLDYVIQTLARDPFSRQAVITIWRECPPPTKDVPCTISAQFLIRNGTLHVVDTMRSSDLWLGWPYDVFNFTMLAAYVALRLRCEHDMHLILGSLTLNAGSQHIYDKDLPSALECLESSRFIKMRPLQLDEFSSPNDLLDHLLAVADGQPEKMSSNFLKELFNDRH